MVLQVKNTTKIREPKWKITYLYPPNGKQVCSCKQDSESWVPDFVVYLKTSELQNQKNSPYTVN
jgi:hypothetical protein